MLEESDVVFLKELAAITIEKARVRPGETRGGMPANNQGITMITPGGNYPALWIRDFAMSLDCGLIDAAEILPQLRLIARCQNGEKERRLTSGGIIPPFAIPDHINFDGGAVFYPGAYSSGEDQGDDPWGPLPPMDDHFYFVHIAYAVWRDTRDAKFLEETDRRHEPIRPAGSRVPFARLRQANGRFDHRRKTAARWVSDFKIRSMCSDRSRSPRCLDTAPRNSWPK